MWQTIGQDAAIAQIQRSLAAGPAHAYAFVGPAGVGKATAAREFAAALNCTSMAGDGPCGECRACRDTLAGQHPDVEFVAPGGLCDESDHRDHADSRDLRICQIRRLERLISLTPYAGGRRVAIVDAADTMHDESANAFLKTLEEPPEGTIIILLVEREERLPETVFSRCRSVSFRRSDRQTILEALQARGAEAEQALAITAAAAGRVGWAFRALEDPSLLAERAQMLDDAVRIAHGGRVERFEWCAGAANRDNAVREQYLRAIDVWEGWWRDVLAAAAGADAGFINQDREPELRREGKLYDVEATTRFLRALIDTREHLYAYVDPQLALENLMLDLPTPSRVAAR